MHEAIMKLAEKYHAGQFRKGPGNVPYIVHPAAVVKTLLEWGEAEDSPAIAIAWGHDLLEDTPVSEAEIRAAAGDRVLAGIRVLTRPQTMAKERYLSQVAACGDREVLLVKLADRLCRTRDYVESKKEKYAAFYLHRADRVFDAVRALPADDPAAASAVAAWKELAGRLNELTGCERVVGSMLGGAVGDALGSPVEFLDLAGIDRVYGGVSGYVEFGDGTGGITDDTQMALFTAEGLLRAKVRENGKGVCHGPSVVKGAYLRWLRTQGGKLPEDTPDFVPDSGWLIGEKALWRDRAPGRTCISALEAGRWSDVVARNTSKGCGTVMRTAPAGLLFDPMLAYGSACDISAITHGHPTGITAGGAMAMLISLIRSGRSLAEALPAVIQFLEFLTTNHGMVEEVPDPSETAAALRKAIFAKNVAELGQGWVAEEALAIGVHCAIAYPDDFRSGVLEAVNITGDSDSTGAIAGNILGALCGVSGIPEEWLANLRERRIVETVAWDLFLGIDTDDDGRVTAEWRAKYPGN